MSGWGGGEVNTPSNEIISLWLDKYNLLDFETTI